MADKYTVNGIAKRVRLMPTGEFVEVYEVSFTTASGVSTSIDVPVNLFTPEEVKTRLEAEANKIEAVFKL